MTKPALLFDFIQYQKDHYPQEKAFSFQRNGVWHSYSTDEAMEIGNKVSRGLLKLGVKPGDKIAVAVYKNRPEWVFLDLGIQQIGAINVPVYPTISSKEYTYIFNDAGVSLAFVGSGDLYDKVKATQADTPSLKEIYTFDQVEGRPFWEDIWSDEGQEKVEELKGQIEPDQLATIIYTSGTTGLPKGVMLSHRNISINALDASDGVPLEVGWRSLSFLPMCHIFERTANYFSIYQGVNIYYTDTKNLGGEEGDLRAVRPHFFTTVPRLLEKVYEKIYARGEELSAPLRSIFFWALKLTNEFDFDKKPKGLDKIKWAIADKLVFSKWRAAMGGEVKRIVSGAAPLPPKILQVFASANIGLIEAYGLTETAPGLAGARPDEGAAKVGLIGPAFPHVELMIDKASGDYKPDEGEILAHGPNVMMGYYNKPEENEKVFAVIDGKKWLRTGDVGKLISGKDGRPLLKVTDRKKELLKTSGGKYVAPAPIESRLKEEFLIEQAMVVGEQKKFVSALIVPAREVLENWCERNEVDWTTVKEVIQNPKVLEKYQELIDGLNPEFSHIEQIKKFKLVPNEWLESHPDGAEAELTPTLKLKRRVIRKKHKEQIDEIYQD